jgi:hypothetical protein
MWNQMRFLLLPLVSALAMFGQPFDSGSTGTDGPLDLSSGDRVVELTPSGVLNYTKVNIPAGRKLTFAWNFRNTPVIMLAKGDVTVDGTIDVSSPDSKTPGPGGFYGGNPRFWVSDVWEPGFGPGGGTATSPSGRWAGQTILVLLCYKPLGLLRMIQRPGIV